uniref:Uncharacterized protein n=2 Tax=Lotharella globosa TaxID=91324 RepID=A0A7S4DTV8_9EUKA
MIKDTLKYPTDPQALDRTLMTITCPCTKDPEYAKRFPGESNLAILARADPTWFKETAGILAGREYPAEKDAKNIIAEKDEAEKDVANSIAEKDVRRDTAEKDAKKDLAEKDAAATAATDTCAEKKSSVPVEAGRTGHRSAEYEKFKKAWADAFVRRMKMHYPKIKDEHIVSVDVGTPVTAEHYLAAPGGATYGLGWGTKKFSPSLESICQPTTPIKGYIRTNQYHKKQN